MDRPDRIFCLGSPGAWISVRGSDAFRFLQTQFSNDLDRSEAHPATYGLWLDRKGKIDADSHVLRRGDEDFVLYSVGCPGGALCARFERYLIADDVVVTDLGSGVAVCSAIGMGVPEALGVEPPASGCFATAEDCHVFEGRRGPAPQFEIVGPVERISSVADRLRDSGFREESESAFEGLRIEAGFPAVPVDAGGGELPQEAGLESAAVSFTKGCYLGQEVVAKVQNSGGFRRRLCRVSGSEAPPRAGDELVQGETVVGWMRSVAETECGWIGFALMKHRQVDRESELRTAEGTIAVRMGEPV